MYNPGEPALKLSETLIQYTTLTVLSSSQALPTSLPRIPVYPEALILRRTHGKQQKHEEPEDKNPHLEALRNALYKFKTYLLTYLHFLSTRLILDLMRPLVNHWFPLTHTSHYVATSSHTDETESKTSHTCTSRYFYANALPATILPISEFEDWPRICWLAYPEAKLWSLRLGYYLNLSVTLSLCNFSCHTLTSL